MCSLALLSMKHVDIPSEYLEAADETKQNTVINHA